MRQSTYGTGGRIEITSDDDCHKFIKHLRDQVEAWRNMMSDICISDRRLTDSIHMAFGLDNLDALVHETLDMLADIIDL